MNTVDIKQGTPEWLSVRAGRVTASRVADVIAKTKSGYSASRKNYMDELAYERAGIFKEQFINSAMQNGIEQEPFARMEYESRTGNMVLEVGFVHHPSIEMAGASPDGVIGDGLLEIKCPQPGTHLDYFIDGKVPEKYKPQMAWQMACTGAQWVDFVSYLTNVTSNDSELLENARYFQVRYNRDNDYIAMLEDEVIKFLIEVDERYQALSEKLKGNK